MYLEQIRPPRAVEQRKDNHMGIKIGINGFGRIGRVVLRILADDPERFDVCGINLRKADVDYMVYLLKYDSVFRNFPGIVEHAGGDLIVNGRKIKVYSESDAAMINWADCGAEYIIESTGANNTTDKASRHFKGGAKKVILTAPAKDDATPTFVFGVNSDEYRSDMKVISNASCTTNCLAPLAYVIHKEFGIEQSLMSTIHASTAKQKAVDSRGGSDWRTGRSILNNIIPTTTGAAKAVGRVIPSLKGKMTGMAFRVPTADVSVVDLTARLSKTASYADICYEVKHASETYMKGIIGYTRDQVVSTDLIGNPCPCIFDETAGISLDQDFVKLIAWYDNEWGYSNMVVRMLEHMHTVDEADAFVAQE
jgi:glyceraldehyde 3-phosphate dehydrogenase